MAKNKQGDFIWYELMSATPQKARAFYKAVAGINIPDKGQETNGVDYRMMSAPDGFMGGMLALTEDMTRNGARPCWLGYVGVDDVDATVAQLKKAGGAVHIPAHDMEGVGRMAMVADPQGAVFYVMRGSSDEESTVYRTMTPGHVAWNELSNKDEKAAVALYTELFGWKRGEVMPMGDMGDYQMIEQSGKAIGAILRLPCNLTHSHWRFYIAVADIEAAAAAIPEAGGTIVQNATEVPGGVFVVVGTDAEGAVFALVGPKV